MHDISMRVLRWLQLSGNFDSAYSSSGGPAAAAAAAAAAAGGGGLFL